MSDTRSNRSRPLSPLRRLFAFLSPCLATALSCAVLTSCGGGGSSDPQVADGAAAAAANGPKMRVLSITPQQAALARWSAPIALSVIPVSGTVLDNNRVLFWSANYPNNYDGSGGRSYTTTYDFSTNTATDRLMTESGQDLFCPGTARLADGRLLVNGGNGNASLSTLYDPATDAWSAAAPMRTARGYNASTPLADGSVLTFGGSWNGGSGPKPAELYTPAGGWRSLSGISTADTTFITQDSAGYFRADNHMWLLPTGNGRVLHAGPASNMHWLDVSGNGSATSAGTRGADSDSMNGDAVMYDDGKILTVGGGVNYDGATGKNSAFIIDTNRGSADVRAISPMAYGRVFANAVVLPNGQVVVLGGQTLGVGFSDANGVLTPELFDPQTEIFTPLPAMSVARNYHSIGLLLPDARVVSAGGGLCNCAGDHLNMQVLSPPYLFNSDGSAATRPQITSAPATLLYGNSISVSTDSAVSAFSLVRIGVATHTVNNDQRRVALTFTPGAGNTYQVNIPSNPGILLPGQWMLFALNAQGTPSVAKIVSVSLAGAPQLTNPGPVTATAAGAVNIPLVASSGSGTLVYGASGLPAGVLINAGSGLISGTATTPGTYYVVASAGNGSATVSTGFTLTVPSSAGSGGTGGPVLSVPAPLAASGSSVNYNPVLAPNVSAQYSWNFGDGSAATPLSASAAASHVFAAPGIYSVAVTEVLADGSSTSFSLLQAVTSARKPGGPAAASGNVMLEPRAGASARLWVVNQDNNSVSVFDTAGNVRLAEIPVGSAPRALALAGDGRVWVTNKQDATISIVSPATLAVVQTLALPRASQPFGIVFSPLDGSAFVALEASGQLLKLDGASGAQKAALAVGTNPRHLALTAAGDKLLVSRFITRPLPGEGTATVSTVDAGGNLLGGEVLLVNPSTLALTATMVLRHSEKTDLENQARGIPNYLGAAAISPDGSSAWIPSKQDNIKRGGLRDGNALTFQSTLRAISSRLDLVAQTEDYPARIDHDNAGMPSAARYHPSGAYLFVALESNRQVAVVDPVGKRELFRIEVGLAPQGLVFSADGGTLYVNNFMARSISVVDLSALLNYGQTGVGVTATLQALGTELLPANVLRGKQLFYDARDTRLARDSYLSCAGCHNDAGFDGRTWDFTSLGEGLRNTIALKGRAGTAQGFMHWSANFDEVQDFEGQIRNLAGGTGLMTDAQFNTGSVSQPLGDKKAGYSPDLDALAAYLAAQTSFAPSPYRNADGTLSSAAQAGKTVFTASCASCHGGAGFTISGDATRVRNIGTIKPSSGKRLGGPLTGIDIPTLRDAWASAPYLHDGSAATISAAITAHNNLALNASDLSNVAAYVQQIGGDEGAAPSNLALGKTATQSSTVYGGVATRAVDGNTDGNWANNSVTATDATAQAWWQVDLGQQSLVQSVQLFNRIDCCADRLANFYVFVAATDISGRTLAQLTADTTVAKVLVASLNGATSVTLPFTAQGRYVKVQLAGTNNLSLAEVQVIGKPSTSYLIACASEGGNCALPPGISADVYYGANGSYLMRSGLSGNVVCNVATFGADPLNGAYKTCSYVVTGTLTKVACALNGALCSLPAGSVGDVYFGSAGTFAVRTGVSGAVCSNIAFPNPAAGAAPTCSYVVTALANPQPALPQTACAVEGATCTLPPGAAVDVVYGSNGKYALRSGVSGSLACNSGSFGGDPVVNLVKSCAYAASGTRTACANDGGFCTLPAGTSGDVYYGGGGKFALRSGMTGVICAAAQFGGDPNPGVSKTCSYVVKP